jgi:hypothetical protein
MHQKKCKSGESTELLMSVASCAREARVTPAIEIDAARKRLERPVIIN